MRLRKLPITPYHAVTRKVGEMSALIAAIAPRYVPSIQMEPTSVQLRVADTTYALRRSYLIGMEKNRKTVGHLTAIIWDARNTLDKAITILAQETPTRMDVTKLHTAFVYLIMMGKDPTL